MSTEDVAVWEGFAVAMAGVAAGIVFCMTVKPPALVATGVVVLGGLFGLAATRRAPATSSAAGDPR
jgi:hypothetical protein